MEKYNGVLAVLICLGSLAIGVVSSWRSRETKRPEPPRPEAKAANLDDDSWSNPEYIVEE